MKPQQITQIPDHGQEVQFDPNAVCDRCHRFGAFWFSDHTLCADCYEEGGSCCLEFGGDDLWESDAGFSQDRR